MSYQRSGRRIRRNHAGYLPRYIVSYDTETLPHPDDTSGKRFSHKFRLGVAIVARLAGRDIVGEKVYKLKHRDDIWTLLRGVTAPNYTTWLVCHNTLFDMIVSGMPEQIERAHFVTDWPRWRRSKRDDDDSEEPPRNLTCIESPPTIIGLKCAPSQGRIVAVDTLNWFQCSLSELGESCDLPKLKMPPFSAPNDKWFTYCERDARIVMRTFLNLVAWVRDNDMGMFRYTGPAQSYAAFRHRYMEHEILAHDNLPVKIVERSGYFGGRFEVFKLGEISETVHQYDVNALFPSVMLNNDFPVALDRFETRLEYLPLLPDIRWRDSLAEVELDTREAVFPMRDPRGVIFPTGRFRTTLCGVELAYAIHRQYVKGIRAWAEYRTEPIFQKWVLDLWAMRKQYKADGNRLYETFVKMLMNSLYGKFGQRRPQWETVADDMSCLPWLQWVEYDRTTGDRTKYRSFGWEVQRERDRDKRHTAALDVGNWDDHAVAYGESEKDGTFVAVSAFVTAAARMRMNFIRSVAGNRECYYQGVDSVIVTQKGRESIEYASLCHPTELGKLRLQISADHGRIDGCSDYQLGEKIVVAGRPKGQAVEHQRQQLCRRFSAKAHLFYGTSVDWVVEELTQWQKTSAYWKGQVDAAGWVEPLELGGMTSCGGSPEMSAAIRESAISPAKG